MSSFDGHPYEYIQGYLKESPKSSGLIVKTDYTSMPTTPRDCNLQGFSALLFRDISCKVAMQWTSPPISKTTTILTGHFQT